MLILFQSNLIKKVVLPYMSLVCQFVGNTNSKIVGDRRNFGIESGNLGSDKNNCVMCKKIIFSSFCTFGLSAFRPFRLSISESSNTVSHINKVQQKTENFFGTPNFQKLSLLHSPENCN